MLKTVTVDDVMSWGPCWDRDEVEDAAGGQTSLTPLEIADLKIKVSDRLWVLLRPEIIEEKHLHELACVFAECALAAAREAGREPDARSWAAIETKRKWLRGEATDEQLAAARGAERAAAEAAAPGGAWGAERAAEREWQLEQVRLVLRDQAEGK